MKILRELPALLIYLGFVVAVNGIDFSEFFSDFQNNVAQKTQLLSGKINDVKEFLESTPKEFWKNLRGDKIEQIDPDNIEKLLDEGNQKLPERVKSALQCRKDVNENGFEAFRQQSRNLKGACLQKALEKFQTQDMTEQQVNEMGKDILKLDMDKLLQMPEKAKQKLLSNFDGYVSSESNKDEKTKLERLRKNLFNNLNENPSQWTNKSFRAIPLQQLFKNIDRNKLDWIPGPVLASRLQELKSLANSMDPKNRRVILRKFLQMENVKNMNSTEYSKFHNKIGNLKQSLKLEDLPTEQQSQFGALIRENEKINARKGLILPGTARKHMFTNITGDNLDRFGKNLLGSAIPSIVDNAIERRQITESNVKEFMEGAKGIGKKKKLESFAKIIEKAKENQDSPSIAEYKDLLPFVSSKVLQKLDESESGRVLRETTCFPPGRMKVLVNKLRGGIEQLPSQVKVRIPYSKLSEQGSNIINIAEGLPTRSLPCSIVSQRYLSRIRNFSSEEVKNNKNSIDCIGQEEAMKFSNYTIMEALNNIEGEVGPGAARILLRILRNYTLYTGAGDGSMKDTAKFFATSDANNIPLSVFAALGPNYNHVDFSIRRELLQRLSVMTEPESKLSRAARSIIVQGGLGDSMGLRPGDMSKIGNAFMDISGSKVANGDSIETQAYLQKMQEWIMEKKRKPCLDSHQLKAIGKSIRNIYGSGSDPWENIREVGCLLYTLKDLNEIPDEAILQQSCEETICKEPNEMDFECMASVGRQDFMMTKHKERMLERRQSEAALRVLEEEAQNTQKRRKKRAAASGDSTACTKASLVGESGFTNSEIYDLKVSEIMACLQYFDSPSLSREKAGYIVEAILKEVKTASNISDELLEKMGHIMKGLSADQIRQLKQFKYETHSQIVEKIGMINDLTKEQAEAFVEKIKQWRPINSMNEEDLAFVNKRICDFTKTDIQRIRTDMYKKSAGLLGQIKNCRMEVYEELAKKAAQAFGTLDKGKLKEIGIVASGFTKQKLESTPNSAFEGISPLAVPLLSNEKIKAIEEKIAEYMDPVASLHLTSSQRGVMSKDSNDKIMEKQNDIMWSHGSTNMVNGLLNIVVILFALGVSQRT